MDINPKVIDISHYDRVAADGFQQARRFGIVGVIHKASEAAGVIDKNYAERRKPALDAGLLYGAYHFIRPVSVNQQVELFLRVARPDDHTLLALDYEIDNVTLAQAGDFITQVESKTGHSCVLYSGNVIKEKLGNRVDAWWGKRRLWLAQYSARPSWPRSWGKYWLWQYTGDGNGPLPHKVPGIEIAGGLDISHYNGTDEQLRAEWAGISLPAQTAVPTASPAPQAPPSSWPATWGAQTGKASFYSDSTNADGSAVHNATDLSAAHLKIPLGTKIRVTRTDNGRSVVVTVHDRGPYADPSHRIIDLRRAAAVALDMITAGVVPVKLERVQ